MSTPTIVKYLHEYGTESHVVVAKLFFSPKHIEGQLQWFILRQKWTENKWEQIAFSDEISFSLRPLENFQIILREERERYVPKLLNQATYH